jgi:hypothetical protein
METCYGGTDVLERPCAVAVARGKDINTRTCFTACRSRRMLPSEEAGSEQPHHTHTPRATALLAVGVL